MLRISSQWRTGYWFCRGANCSRRLVQTSTRLKLAYDLHEAPKPQKASNTAPILFLHGLFGSKKNNRSMSKVLARDLGRPVYALDLRNHGQSPHDKQHDYLSMATDVAGFIDDHSLRGTTIIGHSMGAKTAMALALQEPDCVADIVAVDNAPVDALLSSDFPSYIRCMKEIDRSNVIKWAEADRILQQVEKSVPIRQFLLGNLHREPGKFVQKFRIPLDTLEAGLGHLGDFPFKNPNQVRFEKPALFVRGSKSNYVPDDVLPVIGQFFPNFRLADIDAGHWVISEQPEEFRRAVFDFLNRTE